MYKCISRFVWHSRWWCGSWETLCQLPKKRSWCQPMFRCFHWRPGRWGISYWMGWMVGDREGLWSQSHGVVKLGTLCQVWFRGSLRQRRVNRQWSRMASASVSNMWRTRSLMMMTFWRSLLCPVHLQPTTLIEPRSQLRAWGASSSMLWCHDLLVELK